jgi:hypothetical protein
MPVAQEAPTPGRQALVVGLGAMLGLVAVVFLVIQMDRLLDGAGDVSVEPGDSTFRVGDAERLAGDIEREGPLLLPDPAGGDRDVWLVHIGTADTEGWRVFAARPPTSPRDCYVEWAAGDRTFVDNCDGTVYPPSGEGLPQYPVTIDASGDLSVDLGTPTRSPSSPTTDQAG